MGALQELEFNMVLTRRWSGIMALPFVSPVKTSLQNQNLFIFLKCIRGEMTNMTQLCSSPKWTESGDRTRRCELSVSTSGER